MSRADLRRGARHASNLAAATGGLSIPINKKRGRASSANAAASATPTRTQPRAEVARELGRRARVSAARDDDALGRRSGIGGGVASSSAVARGLDCRREPLGRRDRRDVVIAAVEHEERQPRRQRVRPQPVALDAVLVRCEDLRFHR